MPIYEYRCQACAKTFEVIQRVDDRPLRKCGDCSGKLEKLVSRAAFQLKGGGWYAEGYGKDASKKPEKDAPSKTASTTESKSAKGDAKQGSPASATGKTGKTGKGGD